MTIVAGLVVPGVGVYMGADSAGVNVETLELIERDDPKMVRIGSGDLLIGVTGSFGIIQILQQYAPFGRPSRSDPDSWMATNFRQAIAKAFKFAGQTPKFNHGEKLLVGFGDHLYRVLLDDYLQYIKAKEGYDAIGSGADLALGALYAMSRHGPTSPEVKIRTALEAAHKRNMGVHPPFRIMNTYS